MTESIQKTLKEPGQTMAEVVYLRLRHDIIQGKLAPGTRLRSDEIRKAYDTGISPLREALTRLTAERLVQSSGQRGYSVAPLSPQDVIDTMEARVLIETKALKLSIEKGGVEWEAEILAAEHALKRTPTNGPGAEHDEWAKAHQRFHESLLSASGSPWLIQLSDILYSQSERHRLYTVKKGNPARARDRVTEHDEILKAALDRNVGMATVELERHYRMSAKFVASVVSE